MKITKEADYAVRILYSIMEDGAVVSARDISEKAGVTLRFTLKILSKLSLNNLVFSKKGPQGGYYLAKDPGDISMADIIESIDGDMQICHCLDDAYCCTRVSDKGSCPFRKVFNDISRKVKSELSAVKLNQF